MSARARRAAILGIVAALLLANPLYVDAVVDEPRSRSPTGYTATAVTPTDASDQRLIVRELGHGTVLEVGQLRRANEYQPYGDEYRAPGPAADALERATEGEVVRVDDADAAFTLRRVAATREYVAVADDETTRYYRFSVADDGDDATVTAERVGRSTVAQFLVYENARLYSALPRYQRETVDRVVQADEYGYRPYNDEFVDLTDDLVVRDGTYYVFREGVHVDDFGPSANTLLSLALYLLGVVSLLAAVVLVVLDYRAGGSDP